MSSITWSPANEDAVRLARACARYHSLRPGTRPRHEGGDVAVDHRSAAVVHCGVRTEAAVTPGAGDGEARKRGQGRVSCVHSEGTYDQQREEH